MRVKRLALAWVFLTDRPRQAQLRQNAPCVKQPVGSIANPLVKSKEIT